MPSQIEMQAMAAQVSQASSGAHSKLGVDRRSLTRATAELMAEEYSRSVSGTSRLTSHSM